MKHKNFTVEKSHWIQPVKRGYLMMCCDCCLVHRMDFRIKNDRVQFRVFRAPKYTAAQRKKFGVRLTK